MKSAGMISPIPPWQPFWDWKMCYSLNKAVADIVVEAFAGIVVEALDSGKHWRRA
ncbi:hypothetical protein A2U01_0072129 [Trifolium medium]|uniref:Uncharacterized protein n=1 Tax=Trifolium medium TaxID=97028 RepID=A0A392SS70_9FABA|nr:hypothetical protein [Trifolium medium]